MALIAAAVSAVLVHGAFADGWRWQGVYKSLQRSPSGWDAAPSVFHSFLDPTRTSIRTYAFRSPSLCRIATSQNQRPDPHRLGAAVALSCKRHDAFSSGGCCVTQKRA